MLNQPSARPLDTTPFLRTHFCPYSSTLLACKWQNTQFKLNWTVHRASLVKFSNFKQSRDTAFKIPAGMKQRIWVHDHRGNKITIIRLPKLHIMSWNMKIVPRYCQTGLSRFVFKPKVHKLHPSSLPYTN